MPLKSGEAKVASEGSKKKSWSQQSYPEQQLDEITVLRNRVINSHLSITNYCAECGGGPCVPDEHVFPTT